MNLYQSGKPCARAHSRTLSTRFCWKGSKIGYQPLLVCARETACVCIPWDAGRRRSCCADAHWSSRWRNGRICLAVCIALFATRSISFGISTEDPRWACTYVDKASLSRRWPLAFDNRAAARVGLCHSVKNHQRGDKRSVVAYPDGMLRLPAGHSQH